MKKFTRLSYSELARTHGWSIMYADGYADGEAYRFRGQCPPAYLLWGFDEYAQGFQAGYYVDGHAPSRLGRANRNNTAAVGKDDREGAS